MEPDKRDEVGFRYPQDVFEPERDEAEEAVEAADLILSFVMQSLPDKTKEP
ncbi:MAG: hypothetical protein AAGN15_03450 [Cyanobacteria bacterium J06581_3]